MINPHAEVRRDFALLTERQRKIVRMVSEGFRNHKIASHLGISRGTVILEIQQACSKTDTDSREELSFWFGRYHQSLLQLVS